MGLYDIVEAQRFSMQNSDALKINYLSDEELEVCNYVVNKLPYINLGAIIPGNKISIEQLMELSMNEISIFGNDIYLKLLGLVSKIDICCEAKNIDDFTTIIGYDLLSDGNVRCDSGEVFQYVIPSQLYELSTYLLCHEHIHSLKDTNYVEYKNNMVLGEVIPMFYEFLIYNSKDILKRELIKIRVNNLMEVKREYLDYDFYAKRSSEYDFMFESKCGIANDETKIYEFIRSKLGCYLNSFYYAMILYNLYKKNPNKILGLISKILKHEMTTLQLLEYLGIYGEIRGSVFEKEIGNIRKLIK